MKKVIWSLFDSETAITQELNTEEYTIYSIGLPSSSAITDNFISMDLSRRSCLKKLEKLPKPDIIFASPPCETWVDLNIGNVRFYKRNYNEHNLYWQRNFKPNNYAFKHKKLRLLGQRTAYFTFKIIEKFNPELWCIENGSSSLIFKYLNKYYKLQGNKNKTYYSSYDHVNFSRKPTTIFSNKKLYLRNNFKKGSKIIVSEAMNKRKEGIKYLSDYSERSAVPIELYHHILEIHSGQHQQSLFL